MLEMMAATASQIKDTTTPNAPRIIRKYEPTPVKADHHVPGSLGLHFVLRNPKNPTNIIPRVTNNANQYGRLKFISSRKSV
jgi:hypothetical protein